MNEVSDIAHAISRRLAVLVVPDSEAEDRRRRSERLTEATRAMELWRAAEAPPRHGEKAWHPPKHDPTHPWTLARERVCKCLGKGVTIVLTGTRGNGKTQIAVEAILRATAGGREALFRTAQQLFMEIRASYGDGAKATEQQALAKYRKPKLLVIDEIGQRAETEWENRVFFEILNQRYNDMTDTVMTCNLEQDQLAANLGPSMLSRMMEGGGVIECKWESFR